MPCNGNNHPPDCNCGWGGTYYASSCNYFYASGYWSREASHTNPNARCPVCSASVFFYRSPHDGRVFFDSLGPPWPKHPCTTSEDAQGNTRGASGARRGGWIPFLCDTVQALPGGSGTLLRDVQNRELFTKSKTSSFSLDVPIWIRRADASGRYLISTLKTKSGRTYEFKSDGYRNPEHLAHSAGQKLFRERTPLLVEMRHTAKAVPRSPLPERVFEARKSVAHKPILHLSPKLPKSSDAKPPSAHTIPAVKQPGTAGISRQASKPIKTAPTRSGKTTTPVENSRITTQRSPTAIELAFSQAANIEGGLAALTKLLGN